MSEVEIFNLFVIIFCPLIVGILVIYRRDEDFQVEVDSFFGWNFILVKYTDKYEYLEHSKFDLRREFEYNPKSDAFRTPKAKAWLNFQISNEEFMKVEKPNPPENFPRPNARPKDEDRTVYKKRTDLVL